MAQTQVTTGYEFLPETGFLYEQRRWIARFVRTQPLGTIGFIVIVIIVGSAIFADYLNTTDPTKFSTDILKGPSSSHWFGTNRDGKDIYSRVLYGARVSLWVGIATVTISLVAGTVFALIAGFVGGITDMLLSRVGEMLIAIPPILFALTLAASFGGGLRTIVIAISVLFTPLIMRMMRGAVLQQRQMPFIEAARVIGASEMRIMVRHLLPNLAGLMTVVASSTLPAAILVESGLSFLGVGVAFGEPSWGADLGGKARQYFQQAWWIAIFPGAALSLTVLAFNLLGDSLRDVLDPRLRGTGAQQ